MNTVASRRASNSWREFFQTNHVALRSMLVAVLLLAFYRLRGLPSEREQIVSLICVCLLILTVGREWRKAAITVFNWLPFVVLMVLYDYTRGAADELGMPIQTQLPITMDQLLCDCHVTPVFRSWIPTTPRGSFPTAYWYEGVFSVTYATHFLLPYITAAVLWLKDKDRFHRFRDTFFLLTFAGLAIYVLVPTTPPWLAGEQGLIPGVGQATRTVGNGWRILSVDWAEGLLTKGRAVSNPVAALPSLHAGYSLFFTLMIWPQATWARRGLPGFGARIQSINAQTAWLGTKLWWPGSRVILFLFPLVMAVALMVAAEHYFFDIWLGWLFAFAAVRLFSVDRYAKIRANVKRQLVNVFGFSLEASPSVELASAGAKASESNVSRSSVSGSSVSGSSVFGSSVSGSDVSEPDEKASADEVGV